jgi:DNA-directed RNA polymerase specialized sigma24 family protein
VFPESQPPLQPPNATDRVFPATAWNAVEAAGAGDAQALGDVCSRYVEPARRFLRSLGAGVQDAEDLAQEFFAQWARPENLARMDPGKGRLRSYLKQGLRRRWISAWRAKQAQARGGGVADVGLELADAEAQTDSKADLEYDRDWATAALATVISRLAQEYGKRGRAAVFQAVLPALASDTMSVSYAEAAAAVNLSEGQYKVEVHRLRRRFAEALRQEVAETVSSPAEVEEEARHLLTVLAWCGQDPESGR